MPRPRRDAPNTFSSDWPTAPCDNPDAEAMRVIAANLLEAVGTRSLRSVAEQCGLHHSLVANTLEGRAWPEAVTLIRLERGLSCRLWPAP